MDKTKLELLTICDYASISQDNKLSIIGIFEQIFVSDFPTQHPQLFIVGVLTGPANKALDLALSITTPGGEDAIPVQKINISIGPNGKSNLVATIGNLPINEPGFYKVGLTTGEGKLGEKEFGIFKATAEKLPESKVQYPN